MSSDAYAAASMLLLFLPMTPLLFMGQEWAATAPFLYFTDHEPELGRLITQGRRDEFRHFEAFREAAAHVGVPDPQAEETFQRSKLNWDEREFGEHAAMLRLYRTMLDLRREDVVLASPARPAVETPSRELAVLRVRRSHAGEDRVLVVNFGKSVAPVASLEGQRCLVMSRSMAWSPGALAPMSAVLLAEPPPPSGSEKTPAGTADESGA
jgi:maltooligosyltrehalose trehalohydrolase